MFSDFESEQGLAVKILSNTIQNDRVVHAYLFEKNGYYRCNEFILEFVKLLLCDDKKNPGHDESNCNICTMLNDNCYPELKIINPDGMWIKKEQLDELQDEFNKKAIVGSRKIYIINEADKMNLSAVNSILKFLEEPYPNIIAILVTDNIYNLLDTIISRCQVISLKNTKMNFDNELEIISNLCISDSLEREKFISSEDSKEKIDKIKDFISFYEKNKVNTLLYTQNMWFNSFTDKESNLFAYNVMVLYYRDVLNYKLNSGLKYFIDSESEISRIASNLSENDICIRINMLLQAIDKLKYNINLNLLLDNLIIDLERS